MQFKAAANANSNGNGIGTFSFTVQDDGGTLLGGADTINNFQIINETIVEIEGDASKTSDALNSLSPLVATKVLEQMTPNEVRALASLPPVEGGDVVQSTTQPTPAP
jgi:hypothetical protein